MRTNNLSTSILHVTLRALVTLFVIESIIIVATAGMPHADDLFMQMLLNAVLPVFISGPVIYFWAIKPFMSAYQQVEHEHQDTLDEFETRVEARTQELKQSETRFQDFADSAGDWFWEMDADLKISYMSPSLFRILDVTEDQLIGKTREELASSEEMTLQLRDKWQAHFEDLNSHRPFRDFTYQYAKADGTIHHLSTSGKPIFDENGQFAGYRGTGSDLTRTIETLGEIQRVESQLFNAIEVMEDGFVLFDAQDRMVICNQQYKEMYVEIADILVPGITFTEIIEAAAKKQQISDATHDEQAWLKGRIEKHRNPTGTFDQQLTRGNWVRVIEHKTTDGGIIGLRIDITKEKAEQDERRKLAHAVEQSPSMIFITDDQGNIEYVNPMFCKATGYSADEVIGRNPRILKCDDTPEEVHNDLWQTITSGHEWRGEIKDRRKDGSTYWAYGTVSPVINDENQITHFVSMHDDITQRKDVELRERQAKEQAEAASRSKSELIANMSHELRTPLNAIIGFSDVIKQEMYGPLGNEKYEGYLDDIYSSGLHLLGIINDILDVSLIESGTIQLNEDDIVISDVVNSAIRLIHPRAAIGRVQVSSSIDPQIPPIRADQRRVKQVLINLLSNAVKFTPEGGNVSVCARLNTDASLSIMVNDTGIGMNKNDVATALSTFGQVDSGHNRKYGGTGLGLPLTNGLMELHGGTLDIESEEGCGTSITVTFPSDRVNA